MGFFDKIKQGLSKTRDALSNTLGNVFSGFSEIDEDFYEELEESLILADLGVDTSVKAAELLRKKVKEDHLKTTEEAKTALKEILVQMLSQGDTGLKMTTKPSVVLVIGVNGVGKTTTIGKIATRLVREGKSVLLVAADTFRAAAAISWKSGLSAPVLPLSGRMKVQIRHLLFLTVSALPRRKMWM